MIRCVHCQNHAGRFTKNRDYCALRLLADAPLHVFFAEEARIAAIQAAKGRALNMIAQTRMRSNEIQEHMAQGTCAKRRCCARSRLRPKALKQVVRHALEEVRH